MAIAKAIHTRVRTESDLADSTGALLKSARMRKNGQKTGVTHAMI